jgi:hypothetical protein
VIPCGDVRGIQGQASDRKPFWEAHQKKMRYVLDTNIWIEVSRGRIGCADLTGKAGINIVLAPPVIIELVRGLVKSGGEQFARSRALFRCMAETELPILQLPGVFVSMVLWGAPNSSSGVRPGHYKDLMNLIIHANSFSDFLAETEKPASVWKKMNQLDSIHENILEKELKSLEKLAGASVKAIPTNLARLYQHGGLLPDPEFFEQKFSAAIEFLRSSILQLRSGANPRKNDRGLYIDQQLFFYLAEPGSHRGHERKLLKQSQSLSAGGTNTLL